MAVRVEPGAHDRAHAPAAARSPGDVLGGSPSASRRVDVLERRAAAGAMAELSTAQHVGRLGVGRARQEGVGRQRPATRLCTSVVVHAQHHMLELGRGLTRVRLPLAAAARVGRQQVVVVTGGGRRAGSIRSRATATVTSAAARPADRRCTGFPRTNVVMDGFSPGIRLETARVDACCGSTHDAVAPRRAGTGGPPRVATGLRQNGMSSSTAVDVAACPSPPSGFARLWLGEPGALIRKTCMSSPRSIRSTRAR